MTDTSASDDIAAVTRVVTDYFEAWFVGDPDRMRASLHPALAKRARDPRTDPLALDENDAESMVEIAHRGHGEPADHWQEITVLDLYQDIATVMVRSQPFIEYLHLGRFGDRWLIVNAFYTVLP